MRTLKILGIISIVVLTAVALCGPASAAKYVGSDTCMSCHLKQYNDFVLSGHPYKLRTAKDAKAAGMPLPEGYTWDDISYVIGGRNWKIRYMDKKGYIITMTGEKRDKPGKNQFNLENGTWSNYHAGEKNKKYNCGKCHTTGYSKEGKQDGLEGIVGTWAFPGIQCEACHGPGAKHVAAAKQGKPAKAEVTLNKDASLCGGCHIRGKADKIPASKGFIRHHEQYNELLASPHKSLACVTCHDPHKRAGLAIKVSCVQCHSKQQQEYAGSSMQLAEVKCTDCHMPKATKSAIKTAKYAGDVQTHLYKINLDPNAKMFTDDGKYAKGYLTVEYTCLNCHSEKDRKWALKAAKGVHSYGKK
jgi:hypothetical protein